MEDPAMGTSMFGPGDPAQDRAIAKRRELEAARLLRIKDPKARIMGIDTEALHAQVAEKAQAAAASKALSAQYDQQRLQQDAQLAYLEQERLRAERAKAQFVDQFRFENQTKEKAREYDLNDPQSKLNDLPGRVGDDDERLSVSGMQRFHGEDLSYAYRKKAQQAEQRRWIEEQIAAKSGRSGESKAIDNEYASRAIDVDKIKEELEATAVSSRRENAVAVAEYQLAQAAAKREREAAAQRAELQDNVEEIQNNLASDTLTENPAVGRSFIAPNRLRPDHFKGMSPEEQAAIADAQATQRQQALAAKAAAKAEDRAADAAMEASRRGAAYQDAQVAAMRASMRKQLEADNVKLEQQQFAAKSFLKSEVYTNAIDASYFDQFGQTSR